MKTRMRRNDRWEPAPPRALREPDAYELRDALVDTLGFAFVVACIVAATLLLEAIRGTV